MCVSQGLGPGRSIPVRIDIDFAAGDMLNMSQDLPWIFWCVRLVLLCFCFQIGSAALDLRRQTVGRRTYTFRLQHPERIHIALGAPPPRWYADLCEDPHRQNYHSRR